MTALQSYYPGKSGGQWILGDNCHQQANGQVPVFVVTDLTGVILLSSVPTPSSRWVIQRVRANITRFWEASTAFIKCSVELLDPHEPLPPLTFVEPYRPTYQTTSSGSTPTDLKVANTSSTRVKYPLGEGDEICIYGGYLNQLGIPPQQSDLGTKLLRILVCSIDTVIDSSSAADGIAFTIECRDRMKYLMDSLSSFNSAESEQVLSSIGTAAGTGTGKLSRADVIMAIARRSVGDLRDNSTCGITNCGFSINNDTTNSQSVDVTDGYDGYANYKQGSGHYFLGGRTTDSISEVTVFPNFAIITGRMPFSSGSDLQMNYVVSERVPIEYIKYLSLQEPVMSEVFVDHRTGNYWYCPRGVDTTSLSDPKRFFRTYFSRVAPQGVNTLYGTGGSSPYTSDHVHPCQMLILYREEQSTISWRSNIIVEKAQATSTGDDLSLHLRVIPDRFQGRAFACTYFTVIDPSISSAAEMVGVALAYARAKGKEVRAATCHMVGDPSLTPGEALQILGAAPKTQITTQSHADILQAAIQDKTNFTTYYGAYQQLATSITQAIKNDPNGQTNIATPVTLAPGYLSTSGSNDGSTPTITPLNSGITASQSMCNVTLQAPGSGDTPPANNQQISFQSDPTTIWRVEGIIHRFNDGKPGYYTELALITPF